MTCFIKLGSLILKISKNMSDVVQFYKITINERSKRYEQQLESK